MTELNLLHYNKGTLVNMIKKLEGEIEELKDYLKIMEKGKDNNLNRFLDYKSRNEKAIEYIQKNYYEVVYKTKGTMENDLLNILQGEDNE